MTIVLAKDEGVGPVDRMPGQPDFTVSLGWDARKQKRHRDHPDLDLDICAFQLQANRRALHDSDFVFYNNQATPSRSIVLSLDNTTGEGDGDDEVLGIYLSAVPPSVAVIEIAVSIHQPESGDISFSDIGNASVRVLDKGHQEIVSFNLSEYGRGDLMIVGELYRSGGGWQFRPTGNKFAGLADLLGERGLKTA